MFTGIIEEVGTVTAITRGSRSAKIRIRTALTRSGSRAGSGSGSGSKPGDSISVSGACLTITRLTEDGFVADAMAETLARTTHARLAPGARVNLERAMTLSERLGGHLVSGHVDGTGEIASISVDGIARAIEVRCDHSMLRHVAEKGSVAIDGVSLTVIRTDSSGFSVAVIPHTAKATTLSEKRKGDRVNVECDMIAKYAGHLAASDADGDATSKNNMKTGTLTEEFLRDYGF